MADSPEAYAERLTEIETRQAEARARYQIAYDANDPLISTPATWEAKKAAAKELDSLTAEWNEVHRQRSTARRQALTETKES